MVATELFEIRNSKYLLLVDYYSTFHVLLKLGSTTSRVLVQEMKAVFAELGVPNVIVSDGGPQYTSAEFKDFTKQWQIDNRVSSPRKSPVKWYGRGMCTDYEGITYQNYGRRGRHGFSTLGIQDYTPESWTAIASRITEL